MTSQHRPSRAVRRIGLRIGSLAAAVLVALPAMAQDVPEPGAPELDAITVTATGRSENIQDVPVAITTVDREKRDALTSGGDDIRMLSGHLPSLNVESTFGRIFPRFYIRGLGNPDSDLNASQPVSLVYDGVVQENPLLKGFPLFDLDRVEMARGPQGVRFGRNATAGAIQFESARPQQESGGYGRIGVGMRNTLNIEGAVTGPVGEHSSARLSVLRQSRADWVDNTDNGPGEDLGGYEDAAARLQFLFAPDDRFELLANVHARKLEGTSSLFRADIIKRGAHALVDGFRRDRVSIDGLNEQRLDQLGGSLRMRWNLGRVSLHSITGYESVDAFSRGDIDGSTDIYSMPPYRYQPGFVLLSHESADSLPDHRQWSQEFRVESNDWGRFDWQAGVSWFDERIRVDGSYYVSHFVGERPLWGFTTSRQDNSAWALYASGDFDVSDRFKLRGGLRYTDDRKRFVAEAEELAIGWWNAPVNVSADDEHVSWDLSGVYSVADNVNVYGRVATGFRAPSAQERLLFANRFLPSSAVVTVADSETVLSYETGVKATLWDNRVRLGFALYRYAVDDLQVSAAHPTGEDWKPYYPGLVNVDRVIGQGAELDLEAWLTNRLFVTLGASYNDTEIQDASLRAFSCEYPCTVRDPEVPFTGTVRVDGNPLPQAPRHMYNLTARYGVPLGNAEFFVFTDWAYRSKINFFLYESTEFTGPPLLEGGLRLGVNWKGGRHQVAVYGRNITDETAVVGGIDLYNFTGVVNEPRTWGVEFRAAF